MSKPLRELTQNEQLNFLLTNRIPRHALTKFMGWFSRIESRILTRVSIYLWRLFSDDLNFEESRLKTFNSLQQCFVRQLKEGARVIDEKADVVSPCDAIVGCFGAVKGMTVFQAKGFPYEISDLIPDKCLQEKFRDGVYVTLRLKSTMYHRFHAPLSCGVSQLTYISGDTWNVNPAALKRIEKLYCKNERAVIELNMEAVDKAMALVPVAAILVASMKFNCIDTVLDMNYSGPRIITCNVEYKKGDEMGYFQHGSTIILFASHQYSVCEHIKQGDRIKTGQALLKLLTN